MKKISKMTKTIPAVGVEAKKEDLDFGPPVLTKFKSPEGKTKCAAFLELADTPGKRLRGLSKRAELGKMSGMLFDCNGPFWMKDVEFPLDLVFTDESGRITEKTAMAMDKKGETLYPAHRSASKYAIELPAGFCDRYSIEVGDAAVPTNLGEG